MPACPHCGAEYGPGQRFCEACGKAVPPADAFAGGPRILDASATSGAGFDLLSRELEKEQKKASTALLIVSCLSTLGAVIFGVALYVAVNNGSIRASQLPYLQMLLVFGPVLIYWGLWFWSRNSPMPAAITGLVIFVTFVLVNAAADPRTLLSAIILKVIIIALLVRAIQAGIKYRRLLGEAQPAEAV